LCSGKADINSCAGKFSLGALIAFNGYLAQLVWPMIALGWVTNIFQRGAASMGRLNYILTAQPGIDDRGSTISAAVMPKGEIEFRDLTFAYPTTLAGNSAKWQRLRKRKWQACRFARHLVERASGSNARDCRTDGQREDHSCRARRAPLGSSRRNGTS